MLILVKNDKHKATEQIAARARDLDTYSISDITKLMNEADKTVAESVDDALPEIQVVIEEIVNVMEKGGKLYYIGAGSSGRMGILDASECPPTFGVDSDLVVGMIAGGDEAIRWSIEDAEDSQDAGREEIVKRVTSDDAVIGIAASGTTPYVLAGVKAANEIGAFTAGISCNEGTPLSQVAQCKIEVISGPEILAGSTRLKAGTAQKMVLNMISTTTMIKLGKAYGNMMVNMKATNHKLRERAVGIVKDATEVSEEKARETIDKANGDTRAAILMILYKVRFDEAFAALTEANEHFRDAMHLIEKR